MKRSRLFLITAQILATILFIYNFSEARTGSPLAWITPLVMILLIVINSFWFTRFVSWLIFAVSFFSFAALLSAFTLRWRLEQGFNPVPFYRFIIMYIVFIYVGLAQMKILGGSAGHLSEVHK